MDFNTKLNEYIKTLNCTAKDLSEYSGLSAATISRYRSGSRNPDHKTFQIWLRGLLKSLKKKPLPALQWNP